MDADDIIEAMESTASNSKDRGQIGSPAIASPTDIVFWKRALLRFLDELDGELSVSEVRQALED